MVARLRVTWTGCDELRREELDDNRGKKLSNETFPEVECSSQRRWSKCLPKLRLKEFKVVNLSFLNKG